MADFPWPIVIALHDDDDLAAFSQGTSWDETDDGTRREVDGRRAMRLLADATQEARERGAGVRLIPLDLQMLPKYIAAIQETLDVSGTKAGRKAGLSTATPAALVYLRDHLQHALTQARDEVSRG
jgi:hypothetical protein